MLIVPSLLVLLASLCQPQKAGSEVWLGIWKEISPWSHFSACVSSPPLCRPQTEDVPSKAQPVPGALWRGQLGTCSSHELFLVNRPGISPALTHGRCSSKDKGWHCGRVLRSLVLISDISCHLVCLYFFLSFLLSVFPPLCLFFTSGLPLHFP